MIWFAKVDWISCGNEGKLSKLDKVYLSCLYLNSLVYSILFQEQSITQTPYFSQYYRSSFEIIFLPNALKTTPLNFFLRSFILVSNLNLSIFLPVHFLLSHCSKSTMKRGTVFSGYSIFSHLPSSYYSSSSLCSISTCSPYYYCFGAYYCPQMFNFQSFYKTSSPGSFYIQQIKNIYCSRIQASRFLSLLQGMNFHHHLRIFLYIQWQVILNVYGRFYCPTFYAFYMWLLISRDHFGFQMIYSYAKYAESNYNVISFDNKTGLMIELDNKNLNFLGKAPKHIVRKGHLGIRPEKNLLKHHSTAKSNSSRFAQKSQSKSKKHQTLHGLQAQHSPYYFNLNNAKSQRGNINNEESAKSTLPHDCWSIETSVQTKNISNREENMEKRLIHKERSCRQIEKFDKKDRKFSQNVHSAVHDFENLKEQHRLEKQLMGMVLNERQLHRLNKIYAVEETEYMIRVLNAGKQEMK